MPEETKEIPEMRTPEAEKPKVQPEEEKPISEWSFKEIQTRESKVLREIEKASKVEEIERAKGELAELAERREELVLELREIGGFDDLNERLEILRWMMAEGDLTARDIRDELNFVRGISEVEDPNDSHAGLREWYYREQLSKLSEELRKAPSARKKERIREAGFEDEIESLESLGKKIRKLEARKEELKDVPEAEDERRRIQEEIQQTLEQQDKRVKQLASLGGFEAIPGMGGIEPPPRIEDIGKDNFRDWYKQRLALLEEEYPDQSFDTNWRLVYPLELAINTLLPKYGKEDVYKPLRKELVLELESRRARHNYIYLHRRVAGTGELIGASTLLGTPYIECLLHKPEVAKALRKLEALGEEHLATDNRERRREIKNEMLRLIKEKGSPYLIAAGIYSVTTEAGRHDVILNDSGDFFLGRVFNLPIRVRQFWHDRMGRPEFEELYKALDLKASNFWHVILNGYRSGLFGKKDATPREVAQQFREFCEQYKIKGLKFSGDGDENKKDNKIISFSLKEAEFENLPLTDPEGFNLPRDQLKLCYLDISDADEIRKAILNPGGLLELPNLTQLRAISNELKHLKGREKYKWLREVTKVIVDFWKDGAAPWIEENFPERMRNSFSKKVFPAVAAWTNPRIEMEIKALPPIIRAEDVGWLLDQTIGPRSQREMKKGARTTGNVLLGIIEGLGKHIFKTISRGK